MVKICVIFMASSSVNQFLFVYVILKRLASSLLPVADIGQNLST